VISPPGYSGTRKLYRAGGLLQLYFEVTWKAVFNEHMLPITEYRYRWILHPRTMSTLPIAQISSKNFLFSILIKKLLYRPAFVNFTSDYYSTLFEIKKVSKWG
jgi:hypothetical protein